MCRSRSLLSVLSNFTSCFVSKLEAITTTRPRAWKARSSASWAVFLTCSLFPVALSIRILGSLSKFFNTHTGQNHAFLLPLAVASIVASGQAHICVSEAHYLSLWQLQDLRDMKYLVLKIWDQEHLASTHTCGFSSLRAFCDSPASTLCPLLPRVCPCLPHSGHSPEELSCLPFICQAAWQFATFAVCPANYLCVTAVTPVPVPQRLPRYMLLRALHCRLKPHYYK